MTYKRPAIKKDTAELLQRCKDEYLKHHKEFLHIPISDDKIIFEMANFYLSN